MARTIANIKKQLVVLKLKGTVHKEQRAVAPVILKRAPKREGLLVAGSQGLDARDRFLLGSVSMGVVQHTCCAKVVVDDRMRNHRGVPCGFSCN